ncbi:hypothetical protein ABIC11_004285 [Pseudomonas oryzihabitans]
MNDPTLHTFIAALRFWQLHEGGCPSPLLNVAGNDGEVDRIQWQFYVIARSSLIF